MSNTDTNSDAEDLIASGGLAPADRERCRREAEATLALSPHMLGPGSIYRALVAVRRTPWSDFYPKWAVSLAAGYAKHVGTNILHRLL